MLSLGLVYFPQCYKKKEVYPIEITIKKTPPRTFVRQTTVPKKSLSENNKNKKAKYWSLKRQRVKEESKASKSGMSHNRSSKKIIKKENNKKFINKKIQKKIAKGESNFFISKFTPNSKRVEEYLFDRGSSTIGEALENTIKVGKFTSLNTDRYLYYSFFARIEELIRYRWETRVYNSIMQLNKRNVEGINNKNNWITQIIIRLKPDGSFKNAIIEKASGIKDFDHAALNAFKEVNLFPNPPKEMIEKDGLIHLHYSFVVHWDPNKQIIFQ